MLNQLQLLEIRNANLTCIFRVAPVLLFPCSTLTKTIYLLLWTSLSDDFSHLLHNLMLKYI